MKRFPVVAKIAMAILSKQIDEMLSGTRKHENNSRMLIERYQISAEECGQTNLLSDHTLGVLLERRIERTS